ncbi:NUDIX hydrolase [Lactovum miscens]|uniref:8-oxo-dGTP pyrophosphatase MutT (NUDIX family) n=1 Tax=Lactovum miscens TaxID=190387 RepID=A0A841C399_9LACT|nr:NUDIX hydrolase [Lactovum miscens]MBB5888436.1 8-oxo-dGTP pyrophosphatase MutT (NUDIX family) [Lactovum miscens]
MSYISDIRKKIGHDLLIYVGAGVIVTHEGKILLQVRKDNGQWALHGGGIEVNERLEDTAARELYEETGLIAKKLKLFGVYSGPDRNLKYPNGDEIYSPGIFYHCEDFVGELNPQADEVKSLMWFNFNEIPDNIFAPNRQVITDFIASQTN